ncbi:HYC_CC_PP family protein [Mucilaginibacter sp. X4EP1]|jgi:hypothetical protein|uniref:HYC_CC_PP family protein n=1 Tax=Mucilaginibacter sp. X4EP1 TaxID=2723092 RepID=UPI002167B6C8|nr:hypothetical protein [Mucilaginibacter sp. X4EP1]MCS3811782.1 hypothetical protein [Mucilaginibacter sp. X4EP1]
MIKRIGASLLVLLYLITATGFALNLHYCCSEITSVTVSPAAKNYSSFAIGKMKCCQDKHIEVKVKDAHQVQAQSFLAKTVVVSIPGIVFPTFAFSYHNIAQANHYGKDPPQPLANQPVIYLKNCVFRI